MLAVSLHEAQRLLHRGCEIVEQHGESGARSPASRWRLAPYWRPAQRCLCHGRVALYALALSDAVKPSDPAYQRGVKYLPGTSPAVRPKSRLISKAVFPTVSISGSATGAPPGRRWR